MQGTQIEIALEFGSVSESFLGELLLKVHEANATLQKSFIGLLVIAFHMLSNTNAYWHVKTTKETDRTVLHN